MFGQVELTNDHALLVQPYLLRKYDWVSFDKSFISYLPMSNSLFSHQQSNMEVGQSLFFSYGMLSVGWMKAAIYH